MKTINIDLGDRSYPIYVGDQLIDNPTILLNHIHTHTVVVVTNTTVAPLYLDTVTQSLGDNTHIIPIILPDGELIPGYQPAAVLLQRLNQAG